MIETASRPESSLAEMLAARARGASDARLALDAVLGLFGATGTIIWRGPAWPMLLGIAVCFVAFGAWGIADRELAERTAGARGATLALRAVRAMAVALGVIATVVVVGSALSIALGRMIS